MLELTAILFLMFLRNRKMLRIVSCIRRMYLGCTRRASLLFKRKSFNFFCSSVSTHRHWVFFSTVPHIFAPSIHPLVTKSIIGRRISNRICLKSQIVFAKRGVMEGTFNLGKNGAEKVAIKSEKLGHKRIGDAQA